MPKYPAYPESDFRLRIDKAKEAMSQNGLDALFLTEWENIHYMSGMQSASFAVTRDWPYALILKKDGSSSMVIRGGTEAVVGATSWVTNIHGYRMIPDAPSAIKQAFVELGLAGAKVGAELGEVQAVKFSTGAFLELMNSGGVDFVDGAPALWQIRQVKTPYEVDTIRTCAKIASRGLERAMGKLKAGMTERDVSRTVGLSMMEEGADRPGWTTIVQSGEKWRGGVSGSFPSDIKIAKGDYVQIDFGAMYRHYYSDLNRIAIVGAQPKPSEKDHWNTYAEANRAGTKAIKPGVTAADVFQAISDVFEQAGCKYTGVRAGHGLGLDPHEPPHLGSHDKTVLKTGMVFAVEPSGVPNQDGVKFNCEDDVTCTGIGSERLSTVAQEIFHI